MCSAFAGHSIVQHAARVMDRPYTIIVLPIPDV